MTDKQKWTQDKWHIDKNNPGIMRLNSDPLTGVLVGMRAERVVACVNALAGIKDPKDFVELIKLLMDWASNARGYLPEDSTGKMLEEQYLILKEAYDKARSAEK